MRQIILVLVLAILSGCICNPAEGWAETYDKAIKTRNPELCGTLENEVMSSGCYSGVAKEMKDSTVCSRIKDIKYRTVCFQDMAFELNDSSLCLKVNDLRYQSACYLLLANRTNDKTLCTKILVNEIRNKCTNQLN
jgi:hypothetical protein